ncbi:MAG: ferredoxin reductase [Alphaproteobacteria bacterium]|nr:MAG: ferredoxin reductase [Alphaproteobacteria bacterium]
MKSIAIIGAGMAGARACISLRANGYAGAITLLGEEDLGEPQPVWLLDKTIARELKVDVRKGVAATAISQGEKAVSLSDGSSVAYDKLLIATGARPRTLSIAGGEHALTLRTHDDAIELRKRFAVGSSIIIIGGGFIGLELASSAAKRGCHVTVVEAQPRILMRGVPEAIARIVHARHEQAGVAMLTGVGLSHLTKSTVHLKDGRVIAADTIIAGIGAVPETTLAAMAGLVIDNGIACDEHMRTSSPDIYAAGDCASFIHVRLGNRRMRLEAWRSAQDQATTAAENMLGLARQHSSVPWFWSDQYELSLQIAGVPEMGPVTVARKPNEQTIILFHLASDGALMGASGIGPGNAIARDIKLAEMMIAKGLKPLVDVLADPGQQLKSLLKG